MPYRRAKSGTQIRCSSQPGCAAASASSAARTLSPASASRPSAATAAITWVESVRCLPPALTRPSAASRSSSASSTTCSRPAPATRARNSASTVWSKPGSSRASPSRYFQSIRVRTASAASRSVRFSARCSTVTSASRDGDHPGLPRAPNAAAKSSSASHWPSRSRISTASGRSIFLPPYIAAITTATCRSGSGHTTGCMHMTYPIPRPGQGQQRPQTRSSPTPPARTNERAPWPQSPRINHQDLFGHFCQ